MTDPGPESESTARAAFLTAYESDLAAGRIRTLAEYQSQFPGHETSIADEWQWLEPASVPGGSTGPCPVNQQTIGPYRILRELGRGAQATVYLAEHESLRRQVALKVLRAPMTDGTSTSEQRFRREAEVTASIEHPNICSVYEAGGTDGATWIAMQYVPGSTLATHLMASDGSHRESTVHLPGDASSEDGSGTASTGAAKRSDLMRVVAFVEQAARALHLAHERGLVHRDIKPGNLMVTEGGTPVILDFGLARAADRDGTVDGLGLTRTHDVLGTPDHMAPEQLRSDVGAVDRRVDVYALGVTLFECLTRQRPFFGVSVEALYQQILTVEPPGPRTINPHIPRDLEVVLLTAIERDRARRYQTALDFAEDLRRVRQYEPIRAKPISTLGRIVRVARRHPGVAASLSLAVVSLVAGLVVSLLFLQEAKQAIQKRDTMLFERDDALANWYDTVSVQAASDNVEGRINRMHAQLRERAIVQINRESAGFGDEVARELARVSGGRPGASLNVFVTIVSKANDLGPVGRHAVADLLLPVLRVKMGAAQLDPTPKRAELAVAMAERQVEMLRDLPATDDRKIRARILLLDGLIQNDDPERARKLVESWLRADESLPTDAARLALYRSRLGASLLGLRDAAAAYELLETDGVVSDVVEKYPRTWYSNDAIASLVEALDANGKPSEAARRALGESLRNSRAHRTLGHHTVYATRVALGSHLWDRAVKLYWSSGSREPTDVEGFLDELSRRDDIDEAATCFHLFLSPNIAQNLGLSHADFSRPDIGRLARLAVEHLEALPSRHDSIRARVYEFYGKHLAACGRYVQARQWLDQRIGELDVPVEERWVFERKLGANLAQLGRYERAELLLVRSLEEGSSWYGPTASPMVQTRRSLARLYRKWGKLDNAVEWHLNAIEQRKDEDFDRRFLGSTYLQFGKWDEAEKEFRDVLHRKPEDIGARRSLAHVSLLRGEFDKAMFDKAIAQAEEARVLGAGKRAGKHPRPIALAKNVMRSVDRIQAMALFRRGNPGDIKAALGFFESATAGPEQVNGDGFWSDYGAALVASELGPQATKLLKDLTEKRPEDPLAWHARARFLATTRGLGPEDRRQAVVCAENASEFCNRRRAFVLAMLADAQFHAGDKVAAGATALAVTQLMAGRDAQWLSVEQFRKQCARY